MNDIWWQIYGEGNCYFVLLYGWGLNVEVWYCICEEFGLYFMLYLVDLLGYGCSLGFGVMMFEEMMVQVVKNVLDQVIWFGWSLGGLVVSQMVFIYFECVQVLVIVVFLLCFSVCEGWLGIKLEIFGGFQQQFSDDFQCMVECFLVL